LATVDGLSPAQLDYLQDDSSNSIGALLAHIAVVERGYQILTFEERRPTAQEQAAWEPALTLGAEGRRLLRGQPLEYYLHELSEVRRRTLEGLAEDEINHRGQMRWLRARLGSTASGVTRA
jgi:uncharacterized damage-inducible protein DinB